MAIDRRVARTRHALYEALVGLVREKDYDEIAIDELLRRADVARSTFYAHFRSKDHLLEASLERLRTELIADAQDLRRPAYWSRSRILFEHVGRHADLQLVLARGRGGAIVREAIDRILAELLRGWLPARVGEGMTRNLAIRFQVATMNMLIGWWLEQRPRPAAADIDALFRRLVSDGLPAQAHVTLTGAPHQPPGER